MREIVDSKVEFEQAIFDYETTGWEVVERNPGRAVLKKGLRGEWIIHILLLFLLPIVGNIFFSAYRNFDRPQKLVVRRRDMNKT